VVAAEKKKKKEPANGQSPWPQKHCGKGKGKGEPAQGLQLGVAFISVANGHP
jgi:hypothetical protein